MTKKTIPPGPPKVIKGFHLHGMEWESIEAYKDWCQFYDFNDSIHKSSVQFRRELDQVKEWGYEWDLYKYKEKQKKKTEKALEKLPKELTAYLHILKKSKLLDDSEYIQPLINLTKFKNYWIGDINEWKITSHNVQRQFYSLVDHLLCKYKMPSFMYSAWFKFTDIGNNHQPTAETQKKWFVHLAQGGSPRKLEKMPITFTKKMAHLFMKAPKNYNVVEALRWAQILGLGGDQRLVDMAIYSRYGETFRHEEFWVTVLHFFINNPMLDRAQLGPLVDYISAQKFQKQRVWIENGVCEEHPPPHPNFSMKGRSPEVLLRQMAEWHGELQKNDKERFISWDPHPTVRPLERMEGSAEKKNMKVWHIRELTDNKVLRQEGRKMKHCVSSYVSSCQKGRCSIWSMAVETLEGVERCVTIEVDNNTKTVVQVRGISNRLPKDQEKRIISLWAGENELNEKYGRWF